MIDKQFINLKNNNKLKEASNSTHIIIKKGSPYFTSYNNANHAYPANKKLKKDMVVSIDYEFMNDLKLIDNKVFYRKFKILCNKKRKTCVYVTTYINLMAKNVKIEFINDPLYGSTINKKRIYLKAGSKYINNGLDKNFTIDNIVNEKNISITYEDGLKDNVTKNYIYTNCDVVEEKPVYVIKTNKGYFLDESSIITNYTTYYPNYVYNMYSYRWNKIKKYKSKLKAISGFVGDVHSINYRNKSTGTGAKPPYKSYNSVNVLPEEFRIIKMDSISKRIIEEDIINLNIDEYSRKNNIIENDGYTVYNSFFQYQVKNNDFYKIFSISLSGNSYMKDYNINWYNDKFFKQDITKFITITEKYQKSIIAENKKDYANIMLYLNDCDGQFGISQFSKSYFYDTNRMDNTKFKYNDVYIKE